MFPRVELQFAFGFGSGMAFKTRLLKERLHVLRKIHGTLCGRRQDIRPTFLSRQTDRCRAEGGQKCNFDVFERAGQETKHAAVRYQKTTSRLVGFRFWNKCGLYSTRCKIKGGAQNR